MSKSLHIENLCASVGGKPILHSVNMHIKAGQTHVILGPNGCGKSTLLGAISGVGAAQVDSGHVWSEGVDVLQMSIQERSHFGIFLGYQHPVEVPGLVNQNMLKAALNAKRQAQGLPALNAMEFLKVAKEALQRAKLDASFLTKPVNHTLSGGEKKRNELLQIEILDPDVILLDEVDSGLDVDAVDAVGGMLSHWQERGKTIVLVSHYDRLLKHLRIDEVSVMIKGSVVAASDRRLIEQVSASGFSTWQE